MHQYTSQAAMDLDSPDPATRRRGIFAIIRQPDPEGIKYLRRIAGEDDFIELRYLARKGLNLLSRTGHDVFLVRPEQKRAIVDLREASLVEIAASLESPDPRVRYHALDVARHRKETGLLDYILDMARNEQHREIRATLVRVIGELGFDEGLEVLRMLSRDEDPRVRANALEVIGMHGAENGSELFWWALGDRDHRVRASCIRALVKLEALDLLQYCRPMLDSPSMAERDTGVFCIAMTGGPESVSLLESCLSEPYASIRSKAYRGLLRIADEGCSQAAQIVETVDHRRIQFEDQDFFDLE